MIVNSPLCTRSQGSELVIVILLAPYSAHMASGTMDLPAWVVWFQSGTSLRLVVSNLGTFVVSFFLPCPSPWQEPRVPWIGFWGIFSALYQTCRLLSSVPRLQFREGALDWQALASAVPGGKGRGICDGCTDSYFFYNFLQAGFRLSGWEKALSA